MEPKYKSNLKYSNCVFSGYQNKDTDDNSFNKVFNDLPELNTFYQLIRKQKQSEETDNLLDKITYERHFLKKNSLWQIVGLINERTAERDKRIDDIDKAICDVHTNQFNLNANYSDMDRRLKTNLDKIGTDLELEKSKERINTWQDVSQLRKELVPLLEEYLSSLRKMEILNPGYEEPNIVNYKKCPPVYKMPQRRP